MTQPAERLDLITRPQFGQTLDRRALYPTRPAGSIQRWGGPFFQPALHVVGNWSFYFARQQEAAPNTNIYNDTIRLELSIGTGESTLIYKELPELPGVGTVIHFATEVGRVNLEWTNPPTIDFLQKTDKIVSWAAPGRPQEVNVKQRIQAYPMLPTLPLLPDFVVANSTRIPMFSTRVDFRQLVLLTAATYTPTYVFFADIGGNVVDIHLLDSGAAGVTTTLTIPTRASLVLLGTVEDEPLNIWQADWSVIS